MTWLMAAVALIVIGLILEGPYHARRHPPEHSPIRREPRAYDWQKEQDTW